MAALLLETVHEETCFVVAADSALRRSCVKDYSSTFLCEGSCFLGYLGTDED